MADEMKVRFESDLPEVEGAIRKAVLQWLEESAGELQSDIVRLSRRKTSQTAASYGHVVDRSRLEAFVGSNLENAIWEEFGTGEYALNGDGRKGGWVYKNPNATYNKDGSLRKNSKYSGWVFTLGKTPNRPIFRAFSQGQTKIQRGLERKLRALDS